MLILLLAACYATTMMGTNTDGLVPEKGQREFLVGAGALTPPFGEPKMYKVVPGGGLYGLVGISERVAVGGSFTYVGIMGLFSVDATWQLAVEYQDGYNLALTTGFGFWWPNYGFPIASPYVGLVGSVPLTKKLRPYLGLQTQPSADPDLDYLGIILQMPLGISIRPHGNGGPGRLIMLQVVPSWGHFDGEPGYVGMGLGLAIGRMSENY